MSRAHAMTAGRREKAPTKAELLARRLEWMDGRAAVAAAVRARGLEQVRRQAWRMGRR